MHLRGTRGSPRIGAQGLSRPSQGRSPTRVAVALLCVGLGAGAAAGTEDSLAPGSQASANYAIGYELGRYLSGLSGQGIGIEPQAILRGALDALSRAEPQLDEAAMREELKRLQGGAAVSDIAPGPAAMPAEPPARTRGYMDDFAALNAKRPGVVTLPSGVQYEVLTAGQGRKPGIGDLVTIRYEGRLTTGVVFDTSLDDPEPLRLRVADIVVPGLKEALLHMKAGDKWHVVIPPRMGFGTVGNNMLRKRDLIYDIELLAVESGDLVQPSLEGAAGGAE